MRTDVGSAVRELPRVCQLAIDQHAELVGVASGLTVAQWDAPSLCTGWSVGDVLIHLAGHVHHSTSVRERLGFLARSRFKPEVAAAMDVRRHQHRSHPEILDWFAVPLPLDARRLEIDMRVQLAELTIHGQDIRRALGLPGGPTEEVTRLLLDAGLTRLGSISVAGSRGRARGLRLVATDIDWSTGAGPDVRGRGEAILMALNGRPHSIPELEGDGVAVLAARLQASTR